jgi:hypothetical protein
MDCRAFQCCLEDLARSVVIAQAGEDNTGEHNCFLDRFCDANTAGRQLRLNVFRSSTGTVENNQEDFGRLFVNPERFTNEVSTHSLHEHAKSNQLERFEIWHE